MILKTHTYSIIYLYNRLPIAVSAMYVQKYFNENAKQSALEMVLNIRQEFENLLERVPWMDDETKIRALKKAKAITNHIAYPVELSHNNKIDEHYKDLELDSDSYLLNTLKAFKFEVDYHYGKLYESINKTDWRDHSNVAIVNAFYGYLENSISK